ncbi:mediator of RNA polymerase II transcription subunit 29 isoform X1 [Tympanuchus pallidicinctus]|uniref:mediator of RNA polymerase II transcription subunit 29 isoform X1 n=1 Tax=Tympanuchus pallidicinctus TaxID=109042 RepID=UPI0022870684|nr:mediator of RNA polymerase II transcription subunit 29 isoform X1 [Tympanuchus pallidicinctus]
MAAPSQPPPGPPAAPAPPQLSAAPGPGQGAGPGPPLPAQVAAAQAQDFDPVQRFRLLIPQLKESLQTLMKVAAQNLVQNSNIDNGQKSADGALQRFDKSLEEFYALCDQLELCLPHVPSGDTPSPAPGARVPLTELRQCKARTCVGASSSQRRGGCRREPALQPVPAPHQGTDCRRQGHPQRPAGGCQQDHRQAAPHGGSLMRSWG